jgi:hypothetical protein
VRAHETPTHGPEHGRARRPRCRRCTAAWCRSAHARAAPGARRRRVRSRGGTGSRTRAGAGAERVRVRRRDGRSAAPSARAPVHSPASSDRSASSHPCGTHGYGSERKSMSAQRARTTSLRRSPTPSMSRIAGRSVRPGEEGVEDGDDIRPGRRARVAPAIEERPKVVRAQVADVDLGIVLGGLEVGESGNLDSMPALERCATRIASLTNRGRQQRGAWDSRSALDRSGAAFRLSRLVAPTSRRGTLKVAPVGPWYAAEPWRPQRS